jgi:hypothetical protein
VVERSDTTGNVLKINNRCDAFGIVVEAPPKKGRLGNVPCISVSRAAFC